MKVPLDGYFSPDELTRIFKPNTYWKISVPDPEAIVFIHYKIGSSIAISLGEGCTEFLNIDNLILHNSRHTKTVTCNVDRHKFNSQCVAESITKTQWDFFKNLCLH